MKYRIYRKCGVCGHELDIEAPDANWVMEGAKQVLLSHRERCPA